MVTPAPPRRPPFPRLIHSDTHPFLQRGAISFSEWKDIMAWRGPRMTLGRGAIKLWEGEGKRIAHVTTAMALLRAEEIAQPTDLKGGRRANRVAGVTVKE